MESPRRSTSAFASSTLATSSAKISRSRAGMDFCESSLACVPCISGDPQTTIRRFGARQCGTLRPLGRERKFVARRRGIAVGVGRIAMFVHAGQERAGIESILPAAIAVAAEIEGLRPRLCLFYAGSAVFDKLLVARAGLRPFHGRHILRAAEKRNCGAKQPNAFTHRLPPAPQTQPSQIGRA